MRQLLPVAFALCFCVTANAQISLGAQYQWLDGNGQMVYSDQPPPASVPLSRVIRVGDPVAPSKRSQAGDAPAPASVPLTALRQPADQQTARSKSSPKRPSISEQMIAFEKRRAKRKADRQKRANQARLAKANAKRCDRLKANKAKLDSGVRLRIRDDAGQSRVMTEQDRFAHAEAIAKRLKKCRA